MRLSLATGVGVALGAALFAGCSTSPQSSALPGNPIAGQSLAHSVSLMGQQRSGPRFDIPKHMSVLKALKLQVEGKLPARATHQALLSELKYLENHPERRMARPDKKKKKGLGLWTTLTDYGYVLGQTANGLTTVADVDTETPPSNPGYDPITVKVDHSGNVWNTDEYNDTFEEGMTQESSPTGATLLGDYTSQCPVEPAGYTCEYFYEFGSFDSAVNSSNVFQSDEYVETEACPTYGTCISYNGPAIEYWPNGSPGSTPNIIELGYANPAYYAGYMDVDSSGNLWLDYEGTYGYGVGEITNPTTSPTFVSGIGSLGFWGGVYVTGSGKVTVIDQDSRDVDTCTPSGCSSYLGPIGILGDPVSGGFNSTDSKMAAGDCDAWDDIGTVSSNSWTIAKAPYDLSCLEGAAFTPSDK